MGCVNVVTFIPNSSFSFLSIIDRSVGGKTCNGGGGRRHGSRFDFFLFVWVGPSVVQATLAIELVRLVGG